MKEIEKECLREIGVELKASLGGGAKAKLQKISDDLKADNNYVCQRLIKKGMKPTNSLTTCRKYAVILDEIIRGMK